MLSDDTLNEIDKIIQRFSYKKFFIFQTEKSSYKMKKMLILLSKIDLNEFDKHLLMGRIIDIYTKIEHKYNRYSRYYTFSILTTTIASILTTTFLSLNNTFKNSLGLYWTTWSLSLLISVVNAFSTFYKWDRKYILLFQVLSKLEHEIWTFIELVGIYHISKSKNTFGEYYHKERLKLFMHRIENISKTLNKNLIDLEENDDKKNEEQAKTLQSPLNNYNQTDSYTSVFSPLTKSFKNKQTRAEELQLSSDIDNEIYSRTKDIEKITKFNLTDREKKNINNMIKKNIRNELDKRIKEMTDNDVFITPEELNKLIKNINNKRKTSVDIENQTIANDLIVARTGDKEVSSNKTDSDKDDIVASFDSPINNNMSKDVSIEPIRKEPYLKQIIPEFLYIDDDIDNKNNNINQTDV